MADYTMTREQAGKLASDTLLNIFNEATPDNKIKVDTPLGEKIMEAVKSYNNSKSVQGYKYGILSFKPFISIIDQKEITGIQSLARHNKRHGVEQVGHEFEKHTNKEV